MNPSSPDRRPHLIAHATTAPPSSSSPSASATVSSSALTTTSASTDVNHPRVPLTRTSSSILEGTGTSYLQALLPAGFTSSASTSQGLATTVPSSGGPTTLAAIQPQAGLLGTYPSPAVEGLYHHHQAQYLSPAGDFISPFPPTTVTSTSSTGTSQVTTAFAQNMFPMASSGGYMPRPTAMQFHPPSAALIVPPQPPPTMQMFPPRTTGFLPFPNFAPPGALNTSQFQMASSLGLPPPAPTVGWSMLPNGTLTPTTLSSSSHLGHPTTTARLKQEHEGGTVPAKRARMMPFGSSDQYPQSSMVSSSSSSLASLVPARSQLPPSQGKYPTFARTAIQTPRGDSENSNEDSAGGGRRSTSTSQNEGNGEDEDDAANDQRFGERRLAIVFESYGTVGAKPQRIGTRSIFVPDGIVGKFTKYSEDWVFEIHHGQAVKCKDGVERVCITWIIRNCGSGNAVIATETPKEAMERDRIGRTICNRVFREAVDRRRSEYQEMLRQEMEKGQPNDCKVSNLQSLIKTLTCKRFAQGPLVFGLYHSVVQQNLGPKVEEEGEPPSDGNRHDPGE